MSDQIFNRFKTKFLQNDKIKNIQFVNEVLDLIFHNESQIKLSDKIKNLLEFDKYHLSTKYKCRKDFSTDSEGFAYFCIDCGYQCNSMICTDCFDPEIHKDHLYFLKDGVRGVCDCGNHSLWSEEGTCKKHNLERELAQPLLSQQQIYIFKKRSAYHFSFLYQLFSSLFEQSKTEKMTLKIFQNILLKIDLYGYTFIKTLYDIILNRKTLIQSIRQIFKDQSKEHKFQTQYQYLFKLQSLNKTSQKLVHLLDLIMDKIIDQKQILRLQLTSYYFKHYSNLIQSKFTNLSPHLLSNSRIIQQLVKNPKDKAMLIFTPKPYNGKIKDQIYIHNLYLAYYKYYNHLIYLIELKNEAAVQYWKNFAENGGFKTFGNHCEVFSQNPKQMEISLAKYYSIQTIFFSTAIQLFTAMSKTDSFLKIALNQIFVKIKQSQNQKYSNSFNFFRTYRRLMSLGTFLLLGKNENMQMSFMKSDKAQMKRLGLILKISPTTQANTIKILEKQLQITLQYILNIPFAMQFKTIKIGEKDYCAFQSLQKQYFKKDRLLFSLDVIYFRLILALLTYLYKQTRNKEEILTLALRKLLGQIKIEDPYSQPKQGTPKYTQISICRFLSILHEFMFSDQIDLLLSSHFQPFSQRPAYRNRLKTLYSRFIVSLTKINLSKTTSKKLSYIEIVEKLMFADKKVLQSVLKQKEFSFHPNSKKNVKYQGVENGNQQGLNLVQYCPSLSLLLQQHDLKHFYSNHTTKIDQSQKICLSSPFTSIHDATNKQLAHLIQEYAEHMFRQSLNYLNGSIIDFQQLWDSYITIIYKYSQSLNPNQWLSFLKNGQSYNFLKQLQQLNIIKDYSFLTLALIEQKRKQNISQSSNISQLPSMIKPQNQEQIKIDSSLEAKLNNQPIYIQSMMEDASDNGIEQLLCPLCNEKQPLDKMLILAFLQYKSIPPFLGMPQDQKSMYFQSCGHSISKKCLQSHFSQQNIHKCCPICKSQWNIVLPFKYSPKQSVLQLSSKTIQKLLFSKRSDIKSEQQNYYFQLYKSLLVFLAISYYYNSSYTNCAVYKILANNLIQVQNNQIWIDNIKQRIQNPLIAYLSSKLEEWLKAILSPDIKSISKLDINQISRIDQYIRNFFKQTTEALQQKPNQQFRHYDCSNLQALQGKDRKCLCQPSNKGKTYLICLGRQQIVWCFKCYKNSLLGRYQEDQCLVLETTRGSLFIATKNDKGQTILNKIKEKIFVNEIGKQIQELTEEAIRLRIKYDLKEFKLDPKVLYEAQRNYHLRLYRLKQ